MSLAPICRRTAGDLRSPEPGVPPAAVEPPSSVPTTTRGRRGRPDRRGRRWRLAGLTSPWTIPWLVQHGQRLRHLGDPPQHTRHREAGPPFVAEEPGQVDALHPIEHQHVATIVEEVVAGGGQDRGGAAATASARASFSNSSDRARRWNHAHLQRDQPFVACVDSLEHGGLAAASDDLEWARSARRHALYSPRTLEVGERDDAGVQRGVGEARASTVRGPSMPNLAERLARCSLMAFSDTRQIGGNLAHGGRLGEDIAAGQWSGRARPTRRARGPSRAAAPRPRRWGVPLAVTWPQNVSRARPSRTSSAARERAHRRHDC